MIPARQARNLTFPVLSADQGAGTWLRLLPSAASMWFVNLEMSHTRQWTWCGSDFLGKASNKGAWLWKSRSYDAETLGQEERWYKLYHLEALKELQHGFRGSIVLQWALRLLQEVFAGAPSPHSANAKVTQHPRNLLFWCSQVGFCWLQLRVLSDTSTGFPPLQKGPLVFQNPPWYGGPLGASPKTRYSVLYSFPSLGCHTYPHPSCCRSSTNFNYLLLPPILGLKFLWG